MARSKMTKLNLGALVLALAFYAFPSVSLGRSFGPDHTIGSESVGTLPMTGGQGVMRYFPALVVESSPGVMSQVVQEVNGEVLNFVEERTEDGQVRYTWQGSLSLVLNQDLFLAEGVKAWVELDGYYQSGISMLEINSVQLPAQPLPNTGVLDLTVDELLGMGALDNGPAALHLVNARRQGATFTMNSFGSALTIDLGHY